MVAAGMISRQIFFWHLDPNILQSAISRIGHSAAGSKAFLPNIAPQLLLFILVLCMCVNGCSAASVIHTHLCGLYGTQYYIGILDLPAPRR